MKKDKMRSENREHLGKLDKWFNKISNATKENIDKLSSDNGKL